MELEITNLTSEVVREEKLKKLLDKIARLSGLAKDSLVSVVFVSSKEMARLNKEYRSIKGPTDILTFPLEVNEVFVMPKFIHAPFGEIFLCTSMLRKKAHELNMSLDSYRKLALVHAFLHLKGFNHDNPEELTLMQDKEDEILGKLLKNNSSP